MADTVSRQKRSEIMRKVKGADTSPEIRLRKELWREGARGWRLRSKKLPGKPDLVFSKAGVAVFVDGCFWHGCPTCYRRPKTNRSYWDEKLKRNMKRDRRIAKELRSLGYRVIRVWEHEITRNLPQIAAKIKLASQRPD